MNRRHFLQSSLYASLLYGAGGLPKFINESSAAFQPLGSKRILLNLMMSGGPDMRHIIVPAYSSNSNDAGYHYWRNRTRSHAIANAPSQMQAHWNDNFDHRSHNGTTFGIAKNCGWLTDMWDSGNVAILCNVFGDNTRAHDHAQLMMNQGNRTSLPGQLNRSGWGGRLAVTANSNAVGLTNIPSRFCFGPDGNDINSVNNSNLVSVSDSREIGLYEFDRTNNARNESERNQAARASKSYYKTLQAELPANSIYQRFLEHEAKIRLFGGLIQERLNSVPIPPRIEALYRTGVAGITYPQDDNGNDIPLLEDNYLAYQIRNAFDTLASHDLLNAKVLSMEIGGWDSHADQAQLINSGFADLFGTNKGFSALWQALDQDTSNDINRENLVITAGGEFGRQLRDNGGNGTDHGEGNMFFVFGENVNGGIYGDLFPETEIALIQNTSINTPDIQGRTQWDHPFSQISNWIHSGSANRVFPDIASAQIEQANMFNNLFS